MGAFAGAAQAADEGEILDREDEYLFSLGDVEVLVVGGDGFGGQEVREDLSGEGGGEKKDDDCDHEGVWVIFFVHWCPW